MDPNLVLAIGGAFIAVAVLAGFAATTVLTRLAPARRRLDGLAAAGAGAGDIAAQPLALDQLDPSLERLTRYLPKSPKEMTKLQRRLARAGYLRPSAAAMFTLSEVIVPLVLALPILLILGMRRGLIPAVLLAVIGYLVPGFWLARRIEQRRKVINNGLPDALDLLIVCVEAGLGLDQAILKASEELQVSHPALADELRIITTEIRAGKPRLEAFKNFADRTKVDDVRSLVSMLLQTDRFGTSIAQALRIQAEVSRTKRRQRAEERAQKLGVKLVFPLVFCLFPAMYVVTLGSAVIKFIRFFGAR
jgi:tight adherence protein C